MWPFGETHDYTEEQTELNAEIIEQKQQQLRELGDSSSPTIELKRRELTEQILSLEAQNKQIALAAERAGEGAYTFERPTRFWGD